MTQITVEHDYPTVTTRLAGVVEALAEFALSGDGEVLERFMAAVRARDEVPGEGHPKANEADTELDAARADLETVLAPHVRVTLSRLDAGALSAGLYEVLTPERSAA